MAVPKRKVSPSRRNMRRSHDKLEALNITSNKHTGEAQLGHHISMKDGYYNGKQMFVTKAQKKIDKAEASGEHSDISENKDS